ncbi:septum site-determining protein MinC [Candidatus Thiosymbion oneisti]|uniref:septum site-determining protein MinC n=1 Tax=Candidatus Thiosymbion oneisti TaxID=589554 RepID=UPI000AD837D4|nr:septum site-determining protein MinC [Candidatus Thiosymbion oneisti]
MVVKPESEGKTPAGAVELKAAAFTLPVIHLFDTDMDGVAEQLGTKMDQAPEFFRNTPVVVDLSALPPRASDIQFPLLVGLLRGYGMIPVGVRGGNAFQNQAAEVMELAIMGEATISNPGQATAEPVPKPAAQAAEQAPGTIKPSSGRTSKLVTQPVRSGQRVYAMGGDLSVVGPVSSGAELLADGNIHVYGPLRGRAMAGMSGDAEARIFCQALEAELVSVAGRYRVSERIPDVLKGIPVQIFLDQEILRIEKL